MKKLIVLLIIPFCYNYGQTDTGILEKTLEKLNGLKTIEYKMTKKYLSEEMDQNSVHSGNCYLDFTSNDTLIGVKYHMMVDDKYEQVFDGEQYFDSNVKEKRIHYVKKPKKHQVNSSIFSAGLNEVKLVLPILLKDKTISIKQEKDTIINSITGYKFNFTIPNRFISGYELRTVPSHMKEYIYKYELVISKQEMLPIFIRKRNSHYDQILISLLSDFIIGATRDEKIWSYDRFSEEYIRMSQREFFKRDRIQLKNKIGQRAPDFALPSIGGDTISLSKLDNKLTLLEFWFPNCGPCVEAIPDINEIYEKYEERGLTIYGIEFTRSSDKGLKKYIEKHEIKIPTLYLGEKAASLYGVSAAPTFILLNEQKEILYVHMGFKKEELIKVIEDSI